LGWRSTDLDSVYSLLSTLSESGAGMAFTFEKLLVYQKAVDFADSVCGQIEDFSRGYGSSLTS
jgi:hypothetical protein